VTLLVTAAVFSSLAAQNLRKNRRHKLAGPLLLKTPLLHRGASGGVVNCAECQKEPLTPEHFCPCCGRKLSLQERRALETSSPPSRCQSCGAFSTDGDLCKSCQQAFGPVLGPATVTKPSHDSATAGGQKVPAVDAMTEVALPPPVAKVDAVKIAAAAEIAKAETAKAVADLTAKAHLARAANPAVVPRRPIVSAPPPQRRSRTPMLITAASLIVVVIGAAEGARRLGFLWPHQAAREGQPVQATPAAAQATPAVKSVTRAERPATPAKILAENRAATRRPVPASPPARVAANSPRASASPTGRFFERKDVDEPPQVATRIEPKLPANVPARLRNGSAVVRVLVSRTGHPFHVSLLRGSMLGRSSDDAVVAAVTQWTFSPAKKRGEPVNCWFNIGVPLAQAN
jgi:hypothetical protein